MAEKFGMPKAWVICPQCAAQSWVLPPHGLDACPLIEHAAEQFGLKLDAERMMALRAGISIEEMTRRAQEQENE